MILLFNWSCAVSFTLIVVLFSQKVTNWYNVRQFQISSGVQCGYFLFVLIWCASQKCVTRHHHLENINVQVAELLEIMVTFILAFLTQ